MANRCRQLDVPHSLTSHFASGDLDAAALAGNSLILNLLVPAAGALPVLNWAKDALTEETIPLGLEGSVVDRLRLLNFAVSPRKDIFPACDPNPDFIEQTYVCHFSPLYAVCRLGRHQANLNDWADALS